MGSRSLKTVIAAFAVIVSTMAVVVAYDLNSEKVCYVMGYSHLDTQWQWTLEKTLNEYLPNTLTGHFEHFKKYPDYKFSFEGAIRYKMAKEHYPDLYRELKEWVKKGNWRTSGAFLDGGDVNIPTPESLIHSSLYNILFFEEEFADLTDNWRPVGVSLPDCFGFGYALPTIATHCGFRGFHSQKFNNWGGWIPSPFPIGAWKGVDGSILVTCLKPGDYYNRRYDIRGGDGDWLKQQAGIWATFDYMGVGDNGGAVDDGAVAALINRQHNNHNEDIKVYSAAGDQLFRDLTPEMIDRLPVYDGELVMSTHGVGCYTAHADVKMRNRHNEYLGVCAENVSLVADKLGAASYPRSELREAWVRFAWHHMHDDLTGTSIPEAYTKFTIPDQDKSIEEFTKMRDDGVKAVAGKLDTRVDAVGRIPVVLFNSLGMDRQEVAEVSVTFPSGAPDHVRAYGPDGSEVPTQVLSRSGNTATILLVADVPSMGFSVYQIEASSSPGTMSTGLSVSTTSMENEHYSVTIDNNGDISQIHDKAINKDLLSERLRFGIGRDEIGKWVAWEISWYNVRDFPGAHVDENVQVRVVEEGPVRVVVEVKREKAGSHYTHWYRLDAGGGGRRLEVHNRVDWKTKGQMLKAIFPLTASNSEGTWDLGIGVIRRPNAESIRYEVPGQQWADITHSDGSYGVSVLSDYKVGWHKSDDNTLNLTFIHSPSSNNLGYQGDRFVHRFKFGVYGHAGDWREGQSVKQGKRFNQPLAGVQAEPHDGIAKQFSLLSTDNEKVELMTVKKAERTDEVVVRVREITGNRRQGVPITFSAPVTDARALNGVEEPIGDNLQVSGNSIVFDINGFQPRTFGVSLGGITRTAHPESFLPSVKRGARMLIVTTPAHGGRSVAFRVGARERVRDMYITDTQGRRVADLSPGGQPARDIVVWDGRNAAGTNAPAGAYVVHLSTGTSRRRARLMLAK